MAQTGITVTIHDSLAGIDPGEWDACACPEARDGARPDDPFTTWRFLKTLEDSGSVGPGTGWHPQYLVAETGGRAIACAPLYAKGHSQGEYIFDHTWAQALDRAGGRYYPKLQIAVPFTPVTGRRLLTRPGYETTGRTALVRGAVQLARRHGLSSLHITFCTEDEAAAVPDLMRRRSQQYHWMNRGYAGFEDFLAVLSSRKRKTIRKERATARAFGGTIRQLAGDQIEPSHWDAFWRFYQDTGARKWGTPYLTRRFFDLAHDRLRDDMLLVLAEVDGRPVAGALNFIGASALFGRYWGAIGDYPCLHFELCYYQAMDYAIASGLTRVEAGAQGEHKLARGYLPVATHSLHWVADPDLARAIHRYLEAEGAAVAQDMELLAACGPFRHTTEGDTR